MSDRSPRKPATTHDDIFQALEKGVRGTLAESYFVRKDYKQPAAEERPDHNSDGSGIRDDQQPQSGTGELLQRASETVILSSSANANMGNNNEQEGKTPVTQHSKVGFETERQEVSGAVLVPSQGRPEEELSISELPISDRAKQIISKVTAEGDIWYKKIGHKLIEPSLKALEAARQQSNRIHLYDDAPAVSRVEPEDVMKQFGATITDTRRKK